MQCCISLVTLVSCVVGPTESEASALHRTMLEANLSSEVALIVLDVISMYSTSFRVSVNDAP